MSQHSSGYSTREPWPWYGSPRWSLWAEPSYGAHADAALDAGASTAEVVDVLFGVLPVVGLPRVVAAAPMLAMALGYDTDALEQAGG
jgi:hypothetical protein